VAGRDQPKVSLFPFMSVLACTIGALMTLLVAMSLAAVGATNASTRAYEETVESVQLDRAAIEKERAVLDEAEALWAQVDGALEERGLSAGLSMSSIEAELDLEKRRSEYVETLARIESEMRVIEQDGESIETTVSVLESRRETLPILIDSTGISRHLDPYFVECDAGGATAYRARDDFKYFVSRDELSSSGDFGRYLRRVRALPGSLLVLLVRPDGLATSKRAARVAAGAGIRVARLPLPGTGELDWSLLRRSEGGGN
jgi:hypothetical protein